MTNGRDRLIDAAVRLLAESPDREPSTRELYEAAGVAAPTLYHHFGTKEGLLDAVVEQAFADYLKRKRAMLRTGDLVADFSAGWDLHIQFGVENPVLYALMYDRGRTSAAATADDQLRAGLVRLTDAGLLRMDFDAAATLTTALAIGCVTQLNRLHRTAADPICATIRTMLIAELTNTYLERAPQMIKTSPDSDFNPSIALGGRQVVPRLGYGAMQLAGPGVIGLPDDPNSAIAVLRHAVELGVRFFDTANAYGPRTVNQLIGRALSPYGDDVIIGNKVGAARGPNGEWLTDARPEMIRAQVEDALLDLRTENSRLTYLRLRGDSPDLAGSIADEIPLEDSLGALCELRDQGKIQHIGISGATPELLARAQQLTEIAAVQNRYNLIDRSGVEVLAACEAAGIAFVPYFPLASGRLADLDTLTEPANRLGVSTSVIALAWLLRRSRVIVPIPGTRSIAHLEDNLRAAAVAPDLTADEVDALTATEDETAATIGVMPARMVDALRRPAS